MAQPEADTPLPPPPPEPPSYWGSDPPVQVAASLPSPYSSAMAASAGSNDVSAKSSRSKVVLVVVVLGVAALVVVAFATARHWAKVDVPEQPETFHSEQYLTGAYDVRDDGVNPCWVNQVWSDCINAMVNQYNWACAGVELTILGRSTCDAYGETIDQMKKEDGPGYSVESLGGYGHLNRFPESSTRRVSNNDHRPAVTHEAVCYLGFIGECE